MQKGKNFILQIKNIIYSEAFQRIHCVEFHANKKTPFYDSIFYKLVKKSLGIECELIDMHPQSKLFLKQGINTGFKEFKHPNSLSR